MAAIALLLACAAGLASAAPGRAGEPASGHRIIVRYQDDRGASGGEFPGLLQKISELEARKGVVRAKALSSIGMAVVHCDSGESEEALVEDLESDPSVELVVPDTWVHLDRDDARQLEESAVQSARVAEDLKEALAKRRLSPSVTSHSPMCSAQPACAARGLMVGDCCPTADGTMLSCCSIHESPKVSLRSVWGKHLARKGDKVFAKSDEVVPWSLVKSDDGTFSFKDDTDTFLSVTPHGNLRVTAKTLGSREKFTLIRNSNSTISLKSHFNKYVVALEWGGVFATRENASTWAQFELVSMPGAEQRFPDDTDFSRLWGMNSITGYDIDAPEAWKMMTGEIGAGIVVAVIDTGIDYTHDDLKEQMWRNPKEIPDNGIDDDGNGIIDDIYGADFANEDGDPLDDQMHGTHCAGTIAGVGNNGLGVTGVAWRGVRLMALKFLSASGSGRASDALRALDYAVAHGAKVASNSWGGGASNSALRAAIERAEKAGVLFVAAAGNSGTDNDEDPHYPSSYDVPNVLAVASLAVSGNLSGFSCYGKESVDVAAPGSDIFSTVPGGGYKSLSGTSMACPHVSGLSALVWMYRPQLTMYQVKEVIMASVAKLDQLQDKVVSNGFINAKNALESAWGFEPPKPPVHLAKALTFVDTDPKVGQFGGTITITAAEDEKDIEYYKVYFVSTAGFQLESLGQVSATGEKTVSIRLNKSFALPQYGAELVAVAGNATGEQPASSNKRLPRVALADYGMPEHGPRSVEWSGDTDLRTGQVKGSFRIGRAIDETSVSKYNIYWRTSDGRRGELLGSVPAVGFRQPQCGGASCDLIEVSKTGTNTYRYEREPYGDEESAVIDLSGPATVKIARFSTEDYYDHLKVGGTVLTGSLRDLPLELHMQAGKQSIEWESDQSINDQGWSFELTQEGAFVDFQISTSSVAGEVEVVAAYGDTEQPNETLSARVVDFDASMPPSPAFAPTALAFEDMNEGAGVISGTANVTVAAAAAAQALLDPAPRGVVTAYQLNFADVAGAIIDGKHWIERVNGNESVAFKIAPTRVPSGAAQLAVRAKNTAGLSHTAVYTQLVDVSPTPPGNLSFSGNMYADVNEVSGALTVEPAQPQDGILAYVAYWSKAGEKGEEIGRQMPAPGGRPVVFALPQGTQQRGPGVLVVSAYAWGEMEDGAFAELDDFEPRGLNGARRLEEALLAEAKAQAKTQAEAQTEMWLLPSVAMLPEAHIIWTAPLEREVSPLGSVKSSVTIPGLEAAAATTPAFRTAFARAMSAVLPRVREADVRVLRVLSVTSAAAQQVGPADRRLSEAVGAALSEHPLAAKVEFEILAEKDGLDRVESRIIVLSMGGSAAARFDTALTRELGAADVAAAASLLRTRVAEPKQLLPRVRAAQRRAALAAKAPAKVEAAAAPAPGRKLQAEGLDTATEEAGDTEEALGSAAALGIAGLCAVALSATILCAYVHRARHTFADSNLVTPLEGADSEPLHGEQDPVVVTIAAEAD